MVDHPSPRVTRSAFDQLDGLLFNAVTDADFNPLTLANFDAALAYGSRVVINLPASVLKTGRDEVARVAENIPGLVVPRTLKILDTDIPRLHTLIDDAGLSYPLLVRLAGAHNGVSMVKVASPLDMDAVLGKMAEHCPSMYLTEFVECTGQDGLYRKCRLFVFSTGKVVVRHLFISPEWNVHFRTRSTFMIDRPDLQQEEESFLEAGSERLGEPALAAVRQLRNRLGLDFLGIDCLPLPTGELLLFEANVAMNVLPFPERGQPFDYLWRPRQELQAALHELVDQKLAAGTRPGQAS
jgi:hypothetical protein